MFGSPDLAKLVLEGERERERESERERQSDKMIINREDLPIGLHVLGQTGLWRGVVEKVEDFIA